VRIAERKARKSRAEINIQRNKNHDDDESGEDDLAFGRHRPSHPLDKTIHHALLAGAVELDGELVAVDRGDVAVAEFLVKHAVAQCEGGDRAGRFGDQLALDGERHATRVTPLASDTPLPNPPPQGGRG